MADVKKIVADSERKVKETRERTEQVVAKAGASPVDVQVCFLEGLIGHPEEAKKFVENPTEYCIEHGVLLDPAVVRDILAVVVLGESMSRLEGRVSEGALRDIAGMRDRSHAGVVQGATTVVAGAMAATSAEDLARLKGTATKGFRLPGGRVLKLPADMHAHMVVANNAVAVYGATTVTNGATLVTASTTRLPTGKGGRGK